MRYFVIKDDDDTLIWDAVEEQMYLSENNLGFRKVKYNLIALTKFRPYAEIIEETNLRPQGIDNDIANRRIDISSRIDTTFDFRTDTPPGKDPDALSPTLREYHKLLWSKPLPSGVFFELVDTTPKVYLHHKSEIGEFVLASDAVVPSFTRKQKIADIIDQIPIAEQDEFNTIGYTIGGMMVFPGNKVEGKMTINAARGFHPRIKDRFDLTVECIRRYYLGEVSPLSDPLERYADFFRLFDDFRGYGNDSVRVADGF